MPTMLRLVLRRDRDQTLLNVRGVGCFCSSAAVVSRDAQGVYFGMIGWIKGTLLPAPPGADKVTKRGYDFVAGVIGGTLATIANTPFDVVSWAYVGLGGGWIQQHLRDDWSDTVKLGWAGNRPSIIGNETITDM